MIEIKGDSLKIMINKLNR